MGSESDSILVVERLLHGANHAGKRLAEGAYQLLYSRLQMRVEARILKLSAQMFRERSWELSC